MAIAIIISGMAACGKTTLAKAIADRFNFKRGSGGDALKEIAKKRGFSGRGEDWWDRNEGLSFLKIRRGDHGYDKEVDEALIEMVREGNIVVTSYTLPWLVSGPLKIWLKASREKRAERMVARDKIGYKEALGVIDQRDRENYLLYKDLYGIRLGEDLSAFDFVLGTDTLDGIAVAEIACKIVEKFMGR